MNAHLKNRVSTILKRLDAGAALCKSDGTSEFSREELEASLLAVADLRRQPNETPERSLVRLLQEQDAEVVKIAKALDSDEVTQVLNKPSKRRQVEPFVHEANRLLDEHVGLMKRSNESVPQAYARLASENEPGFIRLWNRIRSMQDEIT